MTDIEYKEFAKKIVSDFFQENTDEDCSQDICITHIGEVFVLKIREATILLDENSYPYDGVDKLKNTFYLMIKNEEVNDLDNIGSLHPTNIRSMILPNFYIFLGIYSAIQNHSDPEYMLLNLGIENPQALISHVNDLAKINKADEYLDSICELKYNLISILGCDKLIALFLWGIITFLRITITKFCKKISAKNFLYCLKTVKEIGEKYPSICNERIALFYYKFKSLFDKDNNNDNFISDDFLDYVLKNDVYDLKGNGIDNSIYVDLTTKHSSFALDIVFLFYYFIYKRPQHIVKLGFTFMSNKAPSDINSAMFSTFRKEDYAPLIQYEYEWWCKETGEKLSLPLPFFEGAIDLKDINIVDYNLNNRNSVIKTLPHSNIENTANDNSQYSDLSLSTQDNTLKSESSSTEIPEGKVANENYERYPSNDISTNRQRTFYHLPYPSIFKKIFSGKAQRRKSIEELYNKLKDNYIECSSTEYFCYVFGIVEKGKKEYKPKESDHINWTSDKRTLQCIIIKLYKPEGEKQIARGIWTKVENCFLLDGESIPPKTMKKDTNHISDPCKNTINALVDNLIKELTK
jgi:hypothetical protein